MDPKLQPVYTQDSISRPQTGETVAQDQNRVLRNTYWLLALSMLPTIVGAWAGMQFNFVRLFVAAPIMTPLLMVALMLGSLFVVPRLDHGRWGNRALIGFP